MPSGVVYQHRRGTASGWTSTNPILANGELGFETDTKLLKIGDGTSAWSALGYLVNDSANQTINGQKTFATKIAFNGNVALNRGIAYTIGTPLTANTTLTSTDSFNQPFNCSSGALTCTLLATTSSGYQWKISKTDNSINPLSITTTTSIGNGPATIKLYRQNDFVVVESTSTSGIYVIVGGNINPARPGPENIYQQISVKAGDTLVGTTSGEQAFASQPIIRAYTAYPGQRYRIELAGVYNISLNGTQRPRIRIGPAATAVSSRTTAIDFGALNALLSTVTDAFYGGDADFVVESTTDTTVVLRCASKLEFTTNANGQLTPYAAGPNGPASSGTITLDRRVDNIITTTDLFGNSSANDNNTLKKLGCTVYNPSAYAA